RYTQLGYNLKVHINATQDTITLKFIKPSPDTKLEGFILGYGSSIFAKQFIALPENGEPYITEVVAEPKYLIAVQPIPPNDMKKHCTGKVLALNIHKPLQLIIGTVTPTSVLLSWGLVTYTLQYYFHFIYRYFTIRYREKENNRKWTYQDCPTTDTVIDKLRPSTQYEFSVRPCKENNRGVWSSPVTQQTHDTCKYYSAPLKHYSWTVYTAKKIIFFFFSITCFKSKKHPTNKQSTDNNQRKDA
uniref:Fibronectin type-III domain-containing protein n=1 Tax=Erpetoichthys calabaricus TaxID=27687 RepID=A0A8C4SKS2_ERPCA